MFLDIFNREDVKSFLSDTFIMKRYNDKDIPLTICDEKVEKEQYSFYIVIDAIIKYFILIGDEDNFDSYFEQLQLIIRKVNTSNDMNIAVIRLLIKYIKLKLEISENTDKNNNMIVEYVYDKYIKDGYLYSVCFEDEKSKEEKERIIGILKKYKIAVDDLENLENTVTDYPFMMAFYAYNGPKFLYNLLIKTVEKNDLKYIGGNDYFLKNREKSIKDLNEFLIKKDIPLKEKDYIIDFVKENWTNLDLSKSKVNVFFIKRSTVGKDSIDLYDGIMDNEKDLDHRIRRILEPRYNNISINTDSMFDFQISLPNINEVVDRRKVNNDIENSESDTSNSYGSINIIILVGTILLMIGIILTIIKIGM